MKVVSNLRNNGQGYETYILRRKRKVNSNVNNKNGVFLNKQN